MELRMEERMDRGFLAGLGAVGPEYCCQVNYSTKKCRSQECFPISLFLLIFGIPGTVSSVLVLLFPSMVSCSFYISKENDSCFFLGLNTGMNIKLACLVWNFVLL